MSRVRRQALELLAGLAVLLVLLAAPALALDPITVSADLDRIEVTARKEAYEGKGETLPVETARGADGATDRMVVRSSTPGLAPTWLVFALRNPTDKQIELWLTADRYNVSGSGVVWPDLDARRITAVTHSTGFAPEPIKNDRVDIFRLTIERGQTVTYVAELATERMSRIYLWKPLEFEQRQRERHLFNGIMLGIMGLMAVFLTAVFAANHKLIFPAAALVAWCVLALLCVDFGFWHKLFQMRPEENAQYRAAAEAAIAASLVVFLFTFLRVSLWHGFARILFVAWIVGQIAIVAVAVLDPKLSATIARMSIAVIGALGAVIIGFLALRRLERALALVPTWLLLLVWLFGAGATLTGRLPGEAPIFGLVAGLVLIMVLIGFTVTQFAFRSNEPLYGINPSQRQLRLAAIEQAGVSVWEWTARRDEIKFDAEIEAAVGLGPGELPSKVAELASLLHPADKERFELSLAAIRQNEGGSLRMDIRLRHTDSTYRCFEIEGATVPTRDRRTLRCVGIVRDVTDAKRANERLLHNAVHDSLTGLPNRGLLLDRIDATMARARGERGASPTVFFLDLDKFRSVNGQFGLIVGDSILLTVARRLQRSLGPLDTLARIGGDQFALLVTSLTDARDLARLAEQLRLALRSPIRIAGQEIVLTGSIGVAMFDQSQADARELLREAEVAMYRAKRAGSDRLEIFRPELRPEKADRAALAADLRRAIDQRQITVLYQPIVALSTEELVGFEAITRWDHPKLGVLWAEDFVPVAEEADLSVQLGAHVLGRCAADLARWQKQLARPDLPLFVSVNIASRELIKPELAQELRHVIGRAVIAPSSLRLELSEALVMENPEQASQILDLLQEVGVGLCLDEVGIGYSSLSYLGRFPFDMLKIDRVLVQQAGQDDTAAALVRSLVAMGHELGRRIAAEGVETPEDAAFLRAIGCASAQGFYYGDPMGEAEIERLLRLIRKADRRMRRRGLVRGQEKRKAGGGQGGQGAPPATQPVVQPVSQPISQPVSAPMPPSAPMAPAVAMPSGAAGRTGNGAGPTGTPPPTPVPPSRPLVQPEQPRSRPWPPEASPATPPAAPAGPASRPLQPVPAGPGAANQPPLASVPPQPVSRPLPSDATQVERPVMPPPVTGPRGLPGERVAANPPPATAPRHPPPATLPPATLPPTAPPIAPAPVAGPVPMVTPAPVQSGLLRPIDAPRSVPIVETAQASPPVMRAEASGSPPAVGPPKSAEPIAGGPPATAPAATGHQPPPERTLPPALVELEAALASPHQPSSGPPAVPPTGPRSRPPVRRPSRTPGERTLPPSVAASLAKIAGRTAAARLVHPDPPDQATEEVPLAERAVPPKNAAE